MCSLIFAFLYWPAGSLLNASDRQAKNTVVMGITMVANILLNLVLVPELEAVGAAIAALAGNAVLFFGAFRATLDVTPFDRDGFLAQAWRILVSAGVMWLLIAFLLPLAHVVLLIPVGAAAYLMMLFLTRALTVQELRTFLAVVLRKGPVSDIVAQP
jgi:O-antigen/teichoic acid export membrane protein